MKDLKFISPFKKLCITIGNLPTAYIESMSYYEGLTFLVNYLANNVIPAVNNNSEVVKELQDQFVILKNYVDNYFDNLDVQEEINNKLDEMADNGELTDIIAQYLGLAGLLIYDSVSDLKAAENLTNGSSVKTLGYYSVGDGGEANYKVREILNTDIVDDIFIIALHDASLVAELILKDSYINSNQAGMKANDNTFDNSSIFESLINTCNTKGLNIELNKGVYYFDNPIEITNRLQSMHIKGQGLPYTDYNNGTTLRYTGNGWFFTFGKCWKCEFADFQIESNENGIKLSDIFFMSYLNRIQFENCKNAILLKQFAYAYLNNIVINTNNSSSEYAIKVGEIATDTTEYLFVNGLICEDDSIHSSNDGIVIYKGIHLSFKDLDLVKKNQAVLIQPVELVRYVYFNNVDITRSHIGFNLDTKTNAIGMSCIELNKIMHNFKESPDSTDRFLIASKGSGVNVKNLIMKNINIIALSGNPDYAIEQLDANVFSNCEISIDTNNYAVPSKMLLSDFEGHYLTRYYQELQQVFKVFNNTPSTSVTLTLLTNSPFNNTPHVKITCNKPYIKSYTVSNTNGGNLTATIQFTDDFTSGNAIFYTDISPYIYNQTSV